MSRTETGPVLLTATGLRKAFGDTEVLRGIDFEVRRGEVVVLIGPSGSGKTTVLRSLNGLETPDAGVLAFDGGASASTGGGPGGLSIDFAAERPLSKPRRAALRDRSAMVFQHHNLFPHMTVLENVIEGPVQVQRVPRAQAVAEASELLARVGLAEKRDAYPHELSGGQQQRVLIAGALALRPELVLADEPVSSLDASIRGEILALLLRLRQVED